MAAEPQLFRFLVFDFHLPQSRGQLSPISGWKPNFTLKRTFATRMWQKFANFGGSRFDSNGEKLISYLIDRKSKIMESQHRTKCTNFIDYPIISLSAFGAVCEKLYYQLSLSDSAYINPHTPVAQKVANEVVFRRFQGEGVEFF